VRGAAPALLAALLPLAASAQPAADLELVALQTSGPGRIGACNDVVARLRNAGGAPTAEAPEVRLVVSGGPAWSSTARASGPIGASETVEVWFHEVPLAGGLLSTLEATADPADRQRESNESNNARRVDREPRVACGAPGDQPSPGRELRVRVRRRATADGAAVPVGAATVTAVSVLGPGAVLAETVTADDGGAALAIPSGERSPVVRVTVTAHGCAPATALATLPAAPGGAVDLDVEISCAAVAAPPPPAAAVSGQLEIETALPGLLRLDDDAPVPVEPGARVTVRRPGGVVRVRLSSAGGTTFHDASAAVPASSVATLVVDAPPLRAVDGADAIEDLRSGLLWSVGATSSASYRAAAATCAGLERAGAGDWRLPTIDELGFVLHAAADGAPGATLRGLSPCCLWSTTEHAVGGQLTFYLDGGHIYGRRPEEAGVGALCVRGVAYQLDPLSVPERYRDRLPGVRSFRPSP
jgi:hypothetical protein